MSKEAITGLIYMASAFQTGEKTGLQDISVEDMEGTPIRCTDTLHQRKPTLSIQRVLPGTLTSSR